SGSCSPCVANSRLADHHVCGDGHTSFTSRHDLALRFVPASLASSVSVGLSGSRPGGPRGHQGAIMKPGNREVDAQLIARAQRGDKRAFDLLVLKYQRRIMRLLARMVRNPSDIEDIAQETF